MEIKNSYIKPTQDGRKKKNKTFHVTKSRKRRKVVLLDFKKCIFKISPMWTHKKLSLVSSC